MIDWLFNVALPALVSALTGVCGLFLFYRQTAKKKDIENVASINVEYRKLNEDLSAKCERLDAKLDEVFELLNKTRRERDNWHNKFACLQIKNAKLGSLKCVNIKCDRRRPPMYDKMDITTYVTA